MEHLVDGSGTKWTYGLLQKSTAAGSTGYQYDALGNLRQVALPGSDTINYLIDPLNRRIGKKKNGQLQYGLIYQDSLRPLAEIKPGGGIRSIFLYGEKPNVPSAMLREGKACRIISDHLGSVRMVIDADTGEVVQWLEYDVWGKVVHDTHPGWQPFGFAGGLYDPDTELTRFGARDYDAETGRWTAKDPILFAGGDANLYGYVLQDPVNFYDKNGAQAVGTEYDYINEGPSSLPEFDTEAWMQCLSDDMLFSYVAPLSILPAVNLKTPYDLRQQGSSAWTSIDRRFPGLPGANVNRGVVVRFAGKMMRPKRAGNYGTAAIIASTFATTYSATAMVRCSCQ